VRVAEKKIDHVRSASLVALFCTQRARLLKVLDGAHAASLCIPLSSSPPPIAMSALGSVPSRRLRVSKKREGSKYGTSARTFILVCFCLGCLFSRNLAVPPVNFSRNLAVPKGPKTF
jgi:hypothetical protein